jgi:hypothetical protein
MGDTQRDPLISDTLVLIEPRAREERKKNDSAEGALQASHDWNTFNRTYEQPSLRRQCSKREDDGSQVLIEMGKRSVDKPGEQLAYLGEENASAAEPAEFGTALGKYAGTIIVIYLALGTTAFHYVKGTGIFTFMQDDTLGYPGLRPLYYRSWFASQLVGCLLFMLHHADYSRLW